MTTRFALGMLGVLLFCSVAHAQGYQLGQYEPTAAGDVRMAVPSPRYTQTFQPAVGLTLDYGSNPLLGGTVSQSGFEGRPILGSQLVGRLDLAATFRRRFQLGATLPVALAERGTRALGVAPISRPQLADPSVALLVSVLGDAAREPFAVDVGGAVWIPVGAEAEHAGDVGPRAKLRATLAGILRDRFTWGFDGGILFRQDAALTDVRVGPGTAGSSLQLGAAVGYANPARNLHLGPEMTFSSVLTRGRAFELATSSLELLFGAHVRLSESVQVGAALGSGLVRTLGTPDLRGLVRLAYLPSLHAVHAEVDTDAEVLAAVRRSSQQQQQAPTSDAVVPLTTAGRVGSADVPAPPVEPPTPDVGPLPRIYFSLNSDQLTPASYQAVEGIAAVLKAAGKVRILVQGHSSGVGVEARSADLSLRRAGAVQRALIEQGIPAELISAEGVGASQPLPGMARTAESRRVEVHPLPSP